MPILALPQRYRNPTINPFMTPGVMTPLGGDTPPALDPRQMDALDSSTPLPQDQDAQPNANSSFQGADVLAQQAMQSPRPRVEPAMPPPGMQLPEPPDVGNAVTAPQLGGAPRIAPPPRNMAAPPQPKQISAADQALIDANTAVKTAEAGRPQSPKSNIGQRIATAILSMTKFAPATDQIVHPKFSDQERAYERNARSAQLQLKNAETSLNSESLAKQRDANVAFKDAEAANLGLANDQRDELQRQKEEAVKAKIADMQSTRNRKFFEDLTKGKDSQFQAVGEPVPDGWHFQEDPERPGFGFAISPSGYKAPKELLQFLPGVKEGEMIRPEELKAARTAANNYQLEQAKLSKPDNKTANRKDYESVVEELKAAGKPIPSYDNWLTEDANRHKSVTTNNNTFVPPPNSQNQEGPAPVEKVPEQFRETVKRIIRGDQVLPSTSRNNPVNQAVTYWVGKVDPGYEASRYTVKQGFANGADGKAALSLDTVIGHAGTLAEDAEKLDNTAFRKYNNFANWLSRETNSDVTTPFRIARRGVDSELATALKNGQANQHEVDGWQQEIDSADSPGTLRNTLKGIANLLSTRLDALEYKRSILPAEGRPRPLISPRSKSVLDRLNGGPSSGQQPAPAAAPQGMVSVQIPGEKPGFIPAANVAAFKAAHPNAVIK